MKVKVAYVIIYLLGVVRMNSFFFLVSHCCLAVRSFYFNYLRLFLENRRTSNSSVDACIEYIKLNVMRIVESTSVYKLKLNLLSLKRILARRNSLYRNKFIDNCLLRVHRFKRNVYRLIDIG